MRTLSVATQADTESTVTTPAYLVWIDFSATLRLSSRGDQSWDGQTWTGGRLGGIGGLSWDGKGQQSGTLELINTDLALSALVLGEGVADRAVRIWKFYGDNPALDDPVAVFYGVMDDADIGADVVRLTLDGQNVRTLSSPRRFIGAGTGFNHLTPAGKKITWGGQTYELVRGN